MQVAPWAVENHDKQAPTSLPRENVQSPEPFTKRNILGNKMSHLLTKHRWAPNWHGNHCSNLYAPTLPKKGGRKKGSIRPQKDAIQASCPHSCLQQKTLIPYIWTRWPQGHLFSSCLHSDIHLIANASNFAFEEHSKTNTASLGKLSWTWAGLDHTSPFSIFKGSARQLD